MNGAMIACVGRRVSVIAACEFRSHAFHLAKARAYYLSQCRVKLSLVALGYGEVGLFITTLFAPLCRPFVCFFARVLATSRESRAGSTRQGYDWVFDYYLYRILFSSWGGFLCASVLSFRLRRAMITNSSQGNSFKVDVQRVFRFRVY